jgi:hypothetical protein
LFISRSNEAEARDENVAPEAEPASAAAATETSAVVAIRESTGAD